MKPSYYLCAFRLAKAGAAAALKIDKKSRQNYLAAHPRPAASLIARRYRDIASAIVIDQGGLDNLSEARLQLIRRFAAAAVLAEQLEIKLARGDEIDITEHGLLCSSLVRIASRIGISRIPKNVSPTLDDIIREHANE